MSINYARSSMTYFAIDKKSNIFLILALYFVVPKAYFENYNKLLFLALTV